MFFLRFTRVDLEKLKGLLPILFKEKLVFWVIAPASWIIILWGAFGRLIFVFLALQFSGLESCV